MPFDIGVSERRRLRRWLVTGVSIAAALCLAGCGEATEGGATQANCNGTNGNAAVAACHPGDQAIQDACPDNSNGEDYASPTDACLEAVRTSG